MHHRGLLTAQPAVGQPTRPTQPFTSSRVDRWVVSCKPATVDVCYLKLGVAPSGERLPRKGMAWCNMQVKQCDPCLTALRLCMRSKWRYINTLHFLSFAFSIVAGGPLKVGPRFNEPPKPHVATPLCVNKLSCFGVRLATEVSYHVLNTVQDSPIEKETTHPEKTSVIQLKSIIQTHTSLTLILKNMNESEISELLRTTVITTALAEILM